MQEWDDDSNNVFASNASFQNQSFRSPESGNRNANVNGNMNVPTNGQYGDYGYNGNNSYNYYNNNNDNNYHSQMSHFNDNNNSNYNNHNNNNYYNNNNNYGNNNGNYGMNSEFDNYSNYSNYSNNNNNNNSQSMNDRNEHSRHKNEYGRHGGRGRGRGCNGGRGGYGRGRRGRGSGRGRGRGRGRGNSYDNRRDNTHGNGNQSRNKSYNRYNESQSGFANRAYHGNNNNNNNNNDGNRNNNDDMSNKSKYGNDNDSIYSGTPRTESMHNDGNRHENEDNNDPKKEGTFYRAPKHLRGKQPFRYKVKNSNQESNMQSIDGRGASMEEQSPATPPPPAAAAAAASTTEAGGQEIGRGQRKKGKFSRRIVQDNLSQSENEDDNNSNDDNENDNDSEDDYSQFQRKYQRRDAQSRNISDYGTIDELMRQKSDSLGNMAISRPILNDDKNECKDGDNGDDNGNGNNFASTEGLSKRAQTMIKQLYQGSYDCMICQSKIGKKGRIWSCSHCDTIFHMTCINRWAVSQEKSEAQSQNRNIRDYSLIKNLRCPACNFEHINTFHYDEYWCYCGKICFDHLPNGQRSIGYTNIPHSCGDQCGKRKSPGEECQHPCLAICHPGSCQRCRLPSKIERHCECGKTSYKLLCGQIEKEPKLCNNTCGKLLNCGKHRCQDTCHHGKCQPCSVTYQGTCFCGQHTKEIECSEAIEVKNENNNENDSNVTYRFKCGNVCNKTLDCGNHECTLYCHSGSCLTCVRRVREPPICACGKTTYKKGSKQYKQGRKSCLDALPTCGKNCGKMLSCNKHFCQSNCHDSVCKDCKIKIKKACRCQSETKTYTCSEYERRREAALASADSAEMLLNPDSWIRCRRVCKKILSCGHHECKVQCCPGKNIIGYHGHICQEICGRMLNCGKHHCESRCHDGQCNPCGVTYHQGIECACGNVYVPGPFRCGSKKVPTCQLRCPKSLPCGHDCPKLCHHGPCPSKCSALETKYCETHKLPIYNLPCHVKNVSCGEICDKKLSCRKHRCKRKCHSGACETEQQLERGCVQTCNEVMKCKHKCQMKCHIKRGIGCDASLCKVKIAVQCQCGNREEMQHCKGRDLMEIKAVSCNEQCVVEDRNRRFRDAFGISPSESQNDLSNNNNNNNSGNTGNTNKTNKSNQQSNESTKKKGNNSKSKKKKKKQNNETNGESKKDKEKKKKSSSKNGNKNEEKKDEIDNENENGNSSKSEIIRIPYAHSTLKRIVEYMSNANNHQEMKYGQYKQKIENMGNGINDNEIVILGQKNKHNNDSDDSSGIDNIKIIVPSFVEYIENVLQCFIEDNTCDLKEFGKKYPKLIDATASERIIICDCNSEKRFILYSMLSEYHLKGDQITLKTMSKQGKYSNNKVDTINGTTITKNNKIQKIAIVISKHENYASVPQFLLSKALVLFQIYGMKHKKASKKSMDLIDKTQLLTLEAIASDKCMIIIDNICNSKAMKSFVVQEQLNAFRGDYRMWRSEKSEVYNGVTQQLEDTQSMYLVFTNEELRDDAMKVMTEFGARKATPLDIKKLNVNVT